MKNSLMDLNNYLFEQIERLQDDSLDDAGLDREIRRGEAVTKAAEAITRNLDIQLRAAKIASEYGAEFRPTALLGLDVAASDGNKGG